jgi:hypothetical protein
MPGSALARRFISQLDRAEKRRLTPSSVPRRRRSRERESGDETARWSSRISLRRR